MADRVTEKDLQAVVNRINRETGNAEEPYRREGGILIANVGNYHLSGAYGGWALHQMVNEGGGIRAITSGYVPKRDLYRQMQKAFIAGLSASKPL